MGILKKSQNKPSDVKKAQWEIDFFYFTIYNGKLGPSIIKTSKMGEQLKFPDLNKFDAETYEYLKKRLNSTKNPLLKSRYSTILWNSPEKHGKYAKIAVDSFLELIKIYKRKDSEADDKNYDPEIVEAAKNAYKIALQSKYKVDESKSEIKRLITQFNLRKDNSIYRLLLVEFMSDDRKNYKKIDYRGISNILWDVSKSLIESNEIDIAIRVMEIGIKVENITSEGKYNWLNEIACLYEIKMQTAENTQNSAVLYFCEKALEYYKMSKNQVKISEMEKKYNSLKSFQKFQKIEAPIDLTQTNETIDKIVRELMNQNSDKIILYLMHDLHILPNIDKIEKFVDELLTEYPLQKIFPTAIVDQSGHVSQSYSKPEDLKYLKILEQFEIELKFITINLLNKVITTGILKNKISYDILLNYLIDNSWIGITIQKSVNNKTIEYNWLDVIAPSLFEYFYQFNYYLLDPSSPPNLVLVIDSLVLKIEGLFREICKNCGVTTFYQTQDKNGRNITREKDINALLREDVLKDMFTEDEIFLFKFLLVEKAGFNLRHKVAHSLLGYDEYSLGIANLLLLVLLRLGKYDLREKVNGDL